MAEGIVPREMVEASSGYLPEVKGIRPPGGVRIHIAGIDVIQDPAGRFLVLEDNLRTPSGVSYVLENRAVMKRIFPRIFQEARVQSVEDYPLRLADALSSLSPREDGEARVVILTPGAFNSAYFEHSFLARRTGCELVEGRDLFVSDDRVWVKTTHGPQPVDVIYRRIDDAFLDPQVFRKDSVLGVAGLMGVYAKGNVTLANGVGNGVADDKAVYPYVPDLIRFFLDAEPILGQVDTFICARPDGVRPRAREPGQARGEGGRRGRRLRHAHRPAGFEEGAGRLRRAHPRAPPEVHRPAAHRALDEPDLDGRAHRAAARRPEALRRDGSLPLGAARRASAGSRSARAPTW